MKKNNDSTYSDYEFKSWSPNTTWWNQLFSGTGDSYTQFIRYLSETSLLDELKYVFNASKASEAEVKNAFKELFSGAKNQEIFDVFWDNQNL